MTEAKTQQVPWATLTQEGHLSRILLLCFGVWLYAADSTLVATVMPVAVEDIGGIPYLSWTYSLYQLGSVVTGAIAGLMVLLTGIAQAQILAGVIYLSLIHFSEPTRPERISYAVFCLKKKNL